MADITQHIIQSSKDGDKDAFRIIVQHYQQKVFSLSVKMLCDEDDAKDATQETFIRMWTNLRSYDCKQKLDTWIYTIAIRVCLNILKARKPQLHLPEDESSLKLYISNADEHQELENKELAAIVRKLTDGLSQKQKLVFTLCQLEGLTTTEVKEITGMNAIQIKSNLYLARKTVKEQLKRLGYE